MPASQKTLSISFIGCLLISIIWLTFCGLETEMAGARTQGREGPAEISVKGNEWHLESGKVMRSAHNDGDEIESDAETFDVETAATETETDQMQNQKSIIETDKEKKNDPCAKWVPESRRNVLFVRALGMKNYTENKERKFMSGEFYAAASWDYAIRENGFNVDEVSWEDFESMSVDILESRYHRIVLACVYHDWAEKCIMDNEEEKLMKLGSKLRKSRARFRIGALYWWDHGEDETPGFFGEGFFHPKQVLTPFDWNHGTNTFLGMFPHFVLDRKELPSAKRGRVGLVLGKRGEYFDDDAIRVIQALAQNFTIHTTCLHGDCSRVTTIEGVINHKKLNPEGYANLMSQASFLLGVGNPIISPSPIIGMANGVAFLNPHRWGKYQHPPLAKEGEPHVYNIHDFGDIDEIMKKAEASVRDENRFASHIPSDYMVERVVDRVCTMMLPSDLRDKC